MIQQEPIDNCRIIYSPSFHAILNIHKITKNDVRNHFRKSDIGQQKCTILSVVSTNNASKVTNTERGESPRELPTFGYEHFFIRSIEAFLSNDSSRIADHLRHSTSNHRHRQRMLHILQ